MQNVQRIVDCIQTNKPFDCDNWDDLCMAFTNAYNSSWNMSLIYILGCIRTIEQYKSQRGSWNIPLYWINPDANLNPYKVFRRSKENNEIVYEFHRDTVPLNKWVEAEISSSAGLTGLTEKEYAKFHFLLDATQAASYLDVRKDCDLFEKHEPVILPVKGKHYLTLDLIYVPPKRFVWGIDAKLMHVNYEQST